MQNLFTNINKLIDFLKLDKKNEKLILKQPTFPLLLPFNLAKKIQKNDINDPIFKQFVPTVNELKNNNKYSLDPLCEDKFSKNKLIKKYNKRALLLCSSTCAMHCRFCFRRHTKNTIDRDFDEEIKIIKDDETLNEIILSGGDPLSLSNIDLKNLLEKLDSISHLKRIRFHTRYIIGFPERIDSEFIEILKKINKQIIFVFHINHPNEIDDEVISSINKLKQNNFLLFNQNVLLKGINDDPNVLEKLYELLIGLNIAPYYLFQLDKVKGAKHFEVSRNQGKALIKTLKENLSGYLCPKYVREIPFEKNKSSI
ncbi:MAG: KamA family radical SAM protein [Parachlamydiales bacterium]|jgi:EF-P beta-lysylation protein EpmB